MSKYLRRDVSHIKDDLLRTAGLLWGAENTSADQIDPVVDLLFGAFAQELFLVQQDVLEHRRRMLEMSVQALLPHELSTARPAHAILHGRPTDANTFTHRTRTSLSTSHGMDVHDRVGRRFVFTPAAEFRLHKGGVLFMAHADKLYSVDRKTGVRRAIGHAESAVLEPNECWIGLELSEFIDPVHGLALFFTLPVGDLDEWSLLVHLPVARFTIGGVELRATPGLLPRTPEDPTFEHLADAVKSAEARATSYYQHKFVTLHVPKHAPTTFNDPGKVPSEFNDLFGQDVLEEAATATTWLRVVFPTNVDPSILRKLQCGMNCFPAINRELVERTDTRSSLVALPLGQGAQFWSVDEVKDAQGQDIPHERRSFKPERGSRLSYAVRLGGLERIDEREAYEHLMDLLNTVRQEHAAFAALNEAELAEGLLKVRAWLEEYRSRPKRPALPPVYLLFSAVPAGNTHVDYWTTTGAAAMVLPSLKPFRLDTGAYMTEVRSMTPPVDGQDTPHSDSLADRLRQVLTNDRSAMPTLHAARIHAKNAIPEHLRGAVRIVATKEVVMGERINEGLLQALVLSITVPHDQAGSAMWESIREHVRIELNDRFQGLLPVHVRFALAP